MDIHRKCAGVFLINPISNMYFVGRRSDISSVWQIPQGGADADESHLECATRELREETGVRTIKLLKNTANLYRYDFPPDIRACFSEHFGIDYKGQELRFFLFQFLGDESEIDLSSTSSPEFSEWKWMEINGILDSMIHFKKDAFREAAKELQLL